MERNTPFFFISVRLVFVNKPVDTISLPKIAYVAFALLFIRDLLVELEEGW